MEELLELVKQNNQMLKKVCDYIDEQNSQQYKDQEAFRNMIINMIANTLIRR